MNLLCHGLGKLRLPCCARSPAHTQVPDSAPHSTRRCGSRPSQGSPTWVLRRQAQLSYAATRRLHMPEQLPQAGSGGTHRPPPPCLGLDLTPRRFLRRSMLPSLPGATTNRPCVRAADHHLRLSAEPTPERSRRRRLLFTPYHRGLHHGYVVAFNLVAAEWVSRQRRRRHCLWMRRGCPLWAGYPLLCQVPSVWHVDGPL